jgi:hypothetical protein
MATRSESYKWYWPTFGNVADAMQASNGAFWAAVFCAVVTALFATISIFTHAGVIGVTASSYVDAVLFALVAWRIRRRSKVFAIIGLALFVLEKVYQYTTQPLSTVGFGVVVAIALLFLFINGVRGNFAYHRLTSANVSDMQMDT